MKSAFLTGWRSRNEIRADGNEEQRLDYKECRAMGAVISSQPADRFVGWRMPIAILRLFCPEKPGPMGRVRDRWLCLGVLC